ncbi:unnamed protein product [Polarella glacialis]|uniref:Uncharacterized protein n=1 Tax=Polarella glacialis TaxID=89957 RepID=A0A813G850_POLGL|nr:unnamed protein product [Polarella glacialis]
MFEDWAEAKSGMPLAARWLAAGQSGQDAPGVLRAGLRRMRNARHFLVEEPHRIAQELLLKQKALDDPARHPLTFVAEPDSLDAQRECLELFVSYLPGRYPDLYRYNASEESITVKPLDQTFALKDWAHAPLELCERLVQEDLILMREQPVADEANGSASSSGGPKSRSYVMAAAAVVFSFNELQNKLGQPAELIHAPVPGFERHIRRTLNFALTNLQAEQPLWRNNWGIAPSGTLDEPLYGSTDAQNQRSFADITVDDVMAKFIKVEYQTIRRLPCSRYLLFTVKTMADPMHSLEKVPAAAACLAASIRGMSPAMCAYKGIEDEPTRDAVLSYLDSIHAE